MYKSFYFDQSSDFIVNFGDRRESLFPHEEKGRERFHQNCDPGLIKGDRCLIDGMAAAAIDVLMEENSSGPEVTRSRIYTLVIHCELPRGIYYILVPYDTNSSSV